MQGREGIAVLFRLIAAEHLRPQRRLADSAFVSQACSAEDRDGHYYALAYAMLSFLNSSTMSSVNDGRIDAIICKKVSVVTT